MSKNKQWQTRYILGEQLGQGGFGTVYKGFDQQLKREVAIKRLPFKNENSLSEAHALASLTHPGVVQIHDVVATEDATLLVMELVKVRAELTADTIHALSRKDFLLFFEQLCEAVKAIHEQGILHLDLKPGNVLMSQEGRLKITDFGIAVVAKSNAGGESQAGTRSGSWFCMTPELLTGGEPGKYSDVFALGVFMYHFLYRRHPFIVDGDERLCRQRIICAKIDKRHRLQVPDTVLLDRLCRNMLSKSVQKRPSVEEVLAQIQELIKMDEVQALQTATIELETESRTGYGKPAWVLVSLSAMLALSYFILAVFKQPIRSTLVVPALIMEHDEFASTVKSQDKSHLTAIIIEDELEAAVISDPYRDLVSKKEWTGSRDWQQEVERLDIHEIIFSEVDCRVAHCTINLGVYSRMQQKVTHFASQTIPHDNLAVFKQAIERLLLKQLGFSNAAMGEQLSISDEDLRTYVDIKGKLQNLTLNDSELRTLLNLKDKYPDFTGFQLLLGGYYLKQFSNTKDYEWLDKGINLVRKMRSQFPNDPVVFNLAFEVYRINKQLDEAEHAIGRLKQLGGVDLSQITLSQAMLTFAKDKQAGYDRLNALDKPRLTNIYFHCKAHMESSLNLHQALITTAKSWLARYPHTEKAQFYLANGQLMAGQLPKAINSFKSIANFTDNYRALVSIANSYFLAGNYRSSLDYYEMAQKIAPKAPEPHLYLGETLKALNRSDAEEHFETVITLIEQIESPDWQELTYLAQAFAHMGRFENANLALQQAAELANNNQWFYILAAYTHSLMNNQQAALHYAVRAQRSGFNLHWFNLPWTQALYTQLKASSP